MSDKPEVAYCNMGQWPVYVGFTTSPKAFKREMKRLNVNGVSGFFSTTHANATTHYFERDGSLTCIITIGSPGDRPIEQVAGLLAHEAVHIAQEIHSHLGEKEPGRESEAYLVQHITQFCLQEAYRTGRELKTVP